MTSTAANAATVNPTAANPDLPSYGLGIRHAQPQDLPHYLELLHDARYLANINPLAAHLPPGQLAAQARRLIENPPPDYLLFTLSLYEAEVIGFVWVTGIDWIAQVGKVGLGLLPHRRSQLGAVALRAAQFYLRTEFNLQVLLSRVREGNDMLMSASWVAERRQVFAPNYFYAGGRYLHASLWTETAEQAAARDAEADRQREERSRRLQRLVREQRAARTGPATVADASVPVPAAVTVSAGSRGGAADGGRP